MLARLIPLLLLVLTRDGVVHRFDGHHDTTAASARATAVTALADGRVAVLAGARILVDGKAIPGRFDDVRALAGGAMLWARSDGAVVQIDLRSGKRAIVLRAGARASHRRRRRQRLRRVRRRRARGRHRAPLEGAGQPIALAAGDGKLWLATKAGPLVEVDRATGRERNLPLGDWWGTIALAYADHALYAVTVAGKLWRIDPAHDAEDDRRHGRLAGRHRPRRLTLNWRDLRGTRAKTYGRAARPARRHRSRNLGPAQGDPEPRADRARRVPDEGPQGAHHLRRQGDELASARALVLQPAPTRAPSCRCSAASSATSRR